MSAQLPRHRAKESCDCESCRDVKSLARELTASQQEAASLRQRLEEHVKTCVCHLDADTITRLEARLAQAQQERDEWQSLAIQPKGASAYVKRAKEAEARASQAKAALEEMQKEIRRVDERLACWQETWERGSEVAELGNDVQSIRDELKQQYRS